jgi:alpha-amylase
VAVVGNHTALGAWQEDKGVSLKWSAGDVWAGQVEVPAGGTIEYKLLIRSHAQNPEALKLRASFTNFNP